MQARTGHGLERYYLYDHDADPSQLVEVQWDNCGLQGAVETFLLPDLSCMTQSPRRAERIGPMGWDLVDPSGEVVPTFIAMTRGGRRFLVGVADWPKDEELTLQDHWASLGGNMRTEVASTWISWRLDHKHEFEVPS